MKYILIVLFLVAIAILIIVSYKVYVMDRNIPLDSDSKAVNVS